MRTTRPLAALAALTLTAALAACSSDDAASPASTESGSPAAGATDAPSADAAEDGALTEVATLDPRVVVTFDGGFLTLDTGSGEVLDVVERDGYLRVSDAGDGRHAFLTTPEGFVAYDSGLVAEGHGDHSHYYASAPFLTDVVLPAVEGGHVVTHAGKTALFSDGTGEVQVLDPAELEGSDPSVETWTAPAAPHHGVAVPLSDGTLFASAGNEEGRYGAVVLDAEGTELASSPDCPGLHGEAVAAGEAVVVGCENGPLLYTAGAFSKVPVEDAYARTGNLFGHPASAVVLGDYKTDPDADLERPERISLINTDTATVRLVDLGASYSFRSLARGPDGEAFVLATDGTLRVINPDTGEELARATILAPWEEPEEWQQPRPAIVVSGAVAYITEPATKQLHALSLSTGEVVRSYDLPHTPDEVVVLTGFPPATFVAEPGEDGAPVEDGHADDGDHEGHDHGDEDGHGDEGHDHDGDGVEDHAGHDH